jgi:hypothetical protein
MPHAALHRTSSQGKLIARLDECNLIRLVDGYTCRDMLPGSYTVHLRLGRGGYAQVFVRHEGPQVHRFEFVDCRLTAHVVGVPSSHTLQIDWRPYATHNR